MWEKRGAADLFLKLFYFQLAFVCRPYNWCVRIWVDSVGSLSPSLSSLFFLCLPHFNPLFSFPLLSLSFLLFVYLYPCPSLFLSHFPSFSPLSSICLSLFPSLFFWLEKKLSCHALQTDPAPDLKVRINFAFFFGPRELDRQQFKIPFLLLLL